MRWTGDISYAIYLIHFAVIWVALEELSLSQDGSVGAAVAWCALVYPISFGYAYLSAVFVERPVRRWAHRFGRRAQPGDRRRAGPRRRALPERDLAAMSRPAVTIVIPTFNRADWLRGAIDSVLAQDYEDLELLVVDDGSTDGTPELLSDYQRRSDRARFRTLAQPNAGQAAAINRGWELARGEVVGYLADDDLSLQVPSPRLVEELVADPDCAVVYPGYHIIDAGRRDPRHDPADRVLGARGGSAPRHRHRTGRADPPRRAGASQAPGTRRCAGSVTSSSGFG